MKSKVEFYNVFFDTLNKKGFSVEPPTSPDYVADIHYLGRTIAFYTKQDSIIKNPFLEVQDKLMERIQTLACTTANACGICNEKPYDDNKIEHMANNMIKINEHENVVLACKQHPLFGYVLSTYKQDADHKNAAIQRQYFYSKEEAYESFATRSGLVDEKKLFGDKELKLIHEGLIKVRTDDMDLSSTDLEMAGCIIERIEEIVPELQKPSKSAELFQKLKSWAMEREEEQEL